MKDTQYYKDKTNAILLSVTTAIDNIEESTSDNIYIFYNMKEGIYEYILSDLELEFKHLVYAFDPNLPLNSYLKETLLPYNYPLKKYKAITLLKHIHAFQDYLTEFKSEQADLSLGSWG